MKRKQITTRVTEEVYKKLEKLSVKEGRSINNLLTRIIVQYFIRIK